MIKNPIATEKAMRLMESQNSLLFEVELKANKPQIKKEIEQQFNAKVENIRVVREGSTKKAYIKFAKETRAIDIATDLGLI